MSTHASRRFSYFIIFTDDFLRFGYVCLMKYKSKAFDKFKEFKYEVEKFIEKSIKALRSDQDEKYLSIEFINFLKFNGIVS